MVVVSRHGVLQIPLEQVDVHDFAVGAAVAPKLAGREAHRVEVGTNPPPCAAMSSMFGRAVDPYDRAGCLPT